MRILLPLVLGFALLIGGCSGSDQTATFEGLIAFDGGSVKSGTIGNVWGSGLRVIVELDDGTQAEAELPDIAEADPVSLTTGVTQLVVAEEGGKWMVKSVKE